ncbi:PREDICTED: uncharacterized protein LOC100635737 isoform X2 [Amphimedon queenslandica]|uniref:BHLH domain-containing protein n=1 Tax=Amphimedon queenslandica TaxID=400682 RepID=A0AAN0J7F3_AMPQE|nr:PREDICTED: uncharacterized protein LOC100635737 isoform X2 [Amphimedon queenslandica]|eukprot:XP_019852682.1 PREDICTED: uncharacterized protein LOC100635737 isoform X2 [Amphimedon queenslandica]
MDHTSAFTGFYSPLATAIPPSLRYPYPPTPSSTPARSVGGGGAPTPSGGILYYPQQPLSSPSVIEKGNQSVQEGQASATTSQDDEDESQKRPPLDKKLRRQIANSNERRRMQSINSGFHTLRMLMPHLQGEKLSKASVLQHAAEHIFRLNQDRDRLIQQNTTMRMMLTKYWTNDSKGGDGKMTEGGKVSKATSPITVDEEKATAKELEQIFTAEHELQMIKEELQRERTLRIQAETKNRLLQERMGSGEDSEEGSDVEFYSSRKKSRITPEPRNNLDIIVRAIRQIEGDAFSRSTTPTCSTQERAALFVPITTSNDTSRL